MKTTVSIPDKIFQRAERLARWTRKSRSQVFSEALKEYVERHAPDGVTEAMNRVCAEVGGVADSFATSAARRVLKRHEW